MLSSLIDAYERSYVVMIDINGVTFKAKVRKEMELMVKWMEK